MLLEMRHTRHPDVEIDVLARENIPQIRKAPRIRGIPPLFVEFSDCLVTPSSMNVLSIWGGAKAFV